MKTRTFVSDFSYDVDTSTRRTFPAGWSGEIEDDVAKMADDAAATDKPAAKAVSKPVATDKPAVTTEEAPAA